MIRSQAPEPSCQNCLADGMHTVAGRQEAALRHSALVAFLDALGRELGGSGRPPAAPTNLTESFAT